MSEVPEQATAETPSRKSTVVMWLALATAFLGWAFDGMEMGLFSMMARPTLENLMGTADPARVSLLISVTTSLFLAGMAVGGVYFGRMGDRLGRVRSLVFTVLVYAIFTGLTGFVHTTWQYCACRFLSAVGLGGEWGLGVALVMETWPGATRPVLAGLLGAAANFGFLFSGVVGLLTKLYLHFAGWAPATVAKLSAFGMILQRPDAPPGVYGLTWRPILMIGFVPALLTLLIRLGVREPERWVRSRQRGEKSSFAELFSPALLRHTLIGAALGGIAVLGMWGSMQTWLQAWVKDLVPSAQADAARTAVTLALAVGAIPGCMFGALAAEWFNRRVSWALLCVLSVASAFILYFGFHAYNTAFLVMAAVTSFWITAFFGWLPLYLPELFPTRLRATGEGFCFNVGRLISAVGVFGTAGLVKLFGQQPLSAIPRASGTMSLIFLVGLVLIWFAPETKGQDLPD